MAPRSKVRKLFGRGAAAMLLATGLTAGCALDDRFVDYDEKGGSGGSESGGSSSGGGDPNGGSDPGSGGKDTGDGGKASGGSDSGGRDTGGSSAGGSSSGGQDTGGQSTGGKGSGGGDSGGSPGNGGGSSTVECTAPAGPLTLDGNFGDNGVFCGYVFTVGWDDAVVDPPCGDGECLTDDLCADLSLPAARSDPDPDDEVDESYYPGGGVMLEINSDGAPNWVTTESGIYVDFGIQLSDTGFVKLQIDDADGNIYCVPNPLPGAYYHWNDFIKDCWGPRGTPEPLGIGREISRMSVQVGSVEGTSLEVTDLCLSDVQVLYGTPIDCLGACALANTLDCSSFDYATCRYNCQFDKYPDCPSEYAALVACQARMPVTGFQCVAGYGIGQGPDYACNDEELALAACQGL